MQKPIETVYLCGPMTGIELYNFPAFDAAREDLREAGFNVLCPVEEDRRDGFNPNEKDCIPFDEYMARDLPMVCRADALVALPGWQASRGVKLEIIVADYLGKPIYSYPNLAIIGKAEYA